LGITAKTNAAINQAVRDYFGKYDDEAESRNVLR